MLYVENDRHLDSGPDGVIELINGCGYKSSLPTLPDAPINDTTLRVWYEELGTGHRHGGTIRK